MVGALAVKQAMQVLYPHQPIDRTNLRAVSKPSPCLTDVAVYVTGGRYQFNTFYVDARFNGLFILQRIDNGQAVSVSPNEGSKPAEIDSLGAVAIRQELPPCELDHLRQLEDRFTETLLNTNPAELFTVREIPGFEWNPVLKNDYLKTDVLNKNAAPCN